MEAHTVSSFWVPNFGSETPGLQGSVGDADGSRRKRCAGRESQQRLIHSFFLSVIVQNREKREGMNMLMWILLLSFFKGAASYNTGAASHKRRSIGKENVHEVPMACRYCVLSTSVVSYGRQYFVLGAHHVPGGARRARTQARARCGRCKSENNGKHLHIGPK